MVNYEVERQKLRETTKISGWLAFFLFAMILGSLLSIIFSIINYDVSEYAGNILVAMSDIIIAVLCFVVAIYAVHAFITRLPNAVFLAKVYVIAIFVTNMLALIGGLDENTTIGGVSQVVRSLIWSAIWFLYLTFSEQVETVIPKEYRKTSTIDIYLAVSVYLIPILMIVIGISTESVHRLSDTHNFLSTVELGNSEYTDGKIVFKKPYGYVCEQNSATNFTYFTLDSDDGGNITICSDYDTDKTQRNFNGYIKNWEDEEASIYYSCEQTNEKRFVNDHNCFYLVKVYSVDESMVYWRFMLMFDDESGKVCVISAYDGGDDEYFETFIKNIRFH